MGFGGSAMSAEGDVVDVRETWNVEMSESVESMVDFRVNRSPEALLAPIDGDGTAIAVLKAYKLMVVEGNTLIDLRIVAATTRLID